MTTETVEVERTVTEEEQLTICDGCGTSDEEHSEIVTFQSSDPRTRGDIHLHRECIGQMNGISTREPQGPSIREKSDWDILYAVDAPDMLATTVGVASLVTAVWALAHGSIAAAITAGGVALVGLSYFVIVGGRQAREAR